MVESNYRCIDANEVDSKAPLNPLFDCEPEIIVDESICVKTEIDRLNPGTPADYGTIYIPSTFDWVDDSNRQLNETNSCRDGIFEPKRKARSKSAIQSAQSNRKKTAITKSTPTESKNQAGSRHAWQLPTNIEKIM